MSVSILDFLELETETFRFKILEKFRLDNLVQMEKKYGGESKKWKEKVGYIGSRSRNYYLSTKVPI